MRAHPGFDALGMGLGATSGDIGKYGDELVAPVPGGKVHGPGLTQKDSPKVSEDLVAHHVPKAVVVEFEVIQIEEYNTDVTTPPGRSHFPAQVHIQVTPIRKIGEWIGKR